MLDACNDNDSIAVSKAIAPFVGHQRSRFQEELFSGRKHKMKKREGDSYPRFLRLAFRSSSSLRSLSSSCRSLSLSSSSLAKSYDRCRSKMDSCSLALAAESTSPAGTVEALLARPESAGGEDVAGGVCSGEGARDGASDLRSESDPSLPALPLAVPRPLPRPRPSPPRPRPPRRCGGGGMTAQGGKSPREEEAERRPAYCPQGAAAIANALVW